MFFNDIKFFIFLILVAFTYKGVLFNMESGNKKNIENIFRGM